MAETISIGLFAKACPTNTNEDVLLTAGADEEFQGVLRVVNLDTTAVHTYGIAHCAASGIATDDERLAKDRDIGKGNTDAGTKEWSIHLGKSEQLRRESGSANNITFHYSGEKKVTS